MSKTVTPLERGLLFWLTLGLGILVGTWVGNLAEAQTSPPEQTGQAETATGEASGQATGKIEAGPRSSNRVSGPSSEVTVDKDTENDVDNAADAAMSEAVEDELRELLGPGEPGAPGEPRESGEPGEPGEPTEPGELPEEGEEGEEGEAEAEDPYGALSPEVMITEPPLTEADFQIFINMYNYILFGTGQLDFATFARQYGVTMRRLNYMTVKITWPLAEESRRAPIINELGLGVLMNQDERELFLKHQAELETLTENLKSNVRK